MSKIREIKWSETYTQWLYNCPGCGYEHAFALKHHTWNNDFDKPTISPSLLNNFTPDRICHSFIRDGSIQFLNDCWHSLAGKTVKLPDYADGTEIRLDIHKQEKERR